MCIVTYKNGENVLFLEEIVTNMDAVWSDNTNRIIGIWAIGFNLPFVSSKPLDCFILYVIDIELQ